MTNYEHELMQLSGASATEILEQWRGSPPCGPSSARKTSTFAVRLALSAAPTRQELSRGAVADAEAWQGSGRYPGVDVYRQVDLNEGDVVYAGYPHPTAYFTTPGAIALVDGDATRLYQGLQVAPHKGIYRPQIRAYTVAQKTAAACGLTEANPQFGPGGLPQLYIPKWQQVLTPGKITDMHNWEHAG